MRLMLQRLGREVRDGVNGEHDAKRKLRLGAIERATSKVYDSSFAQRDAMGHRCADQQRPVRAARRMHAGVRGARLGTIS